MTTSEMAAPQPEQGQHHVPSYKPSDSELTIVPSPASPITGAQTPTTSQSHVPFDLEANQAARQSGPKGPPGGWLAQHMSRNQEIAFNITICLVQLLPQACLTTCFPIIKTLVEDFGISDPAVLPWVVAAYALSFGTTILLAGRLGDIFGHKNVVMLGFIWLSLFSVVAGVSRYTSYEVFFAARAMQGLGSAMMNPNALALLGRSYPPNSKSKIIAFSAFGLCAPLGAYTGMLGSAVLGQLVHWSWSFYVIAITSAGLAIVARFSLPSPPKTPKQMLPFFKKLGSMDWLGGITGVGGLVAIQISLISAPVQGWNTQWVYMLLIIGIILVAFFVIVELKVSIEPLVPFRLLNSDVAFVLAAVACGWGTFGVWTYYLWRFLLGVWNDSPLQAALHVLPIVPVALIAAVLTAFLMQKTQPAWILLGALIAFTLGPTFLATNTTTSPYWTFTFLSLLVTPFGMDMSFPSATFVMSNSLPIDKQGVGGSLVTTVVNYSISLGLGLASTVEVRTNDNGRDMFRGFHSAWIFGLGLGLIGIVVCVVFVLKSYLWPSLPTTPLGLATASRVAEQPITRMKSTETSSSSTSTVVADSGKEKITPPAVPVIPEEHVKSG